LHYVGGITHVENICRKNVQLAIDKLATLGLGLGFRARISDHAGSYSRSG